MILIPCNLMGMDAKQEVFGVAWCHGAPGIGLSRIAALKLTQDLRYRPQVDASIATTRRDLQSPQNETLSASCCLCHGVCGNSETLLIARQFLGDHSHDPLLTKLAEAAHRHENENALWNCGITGGGESPGLLLGLAGIGHFFLRLANPQIISSVLLP